ncbi:MAG: hypothetical protein BIFFINMI_00829 [Phycisphaerae bacterium]|nr:hypothetical protein [Phycisphaerae bacterium]
MRDALDFFTPSRLTKIVMLAGLFFWLFHGTMIRLFLVWLHNDNWSHGLVIPFFCVGILLAIRDKWLDVPLRPTWAGLGVIALALGCFLFATYWIKLIMGQDYSWWLLLVGMVLALCGWRFLGAVWFPLVFILFGIRIGGILYDPISTKLQQVAAKSSALVLKLVGIRADLNGVVIDVFTRSGKMASLQVAEACSGMKIMMAFMALGALMAYMARRPLWHRLILLAATIPIAIASNVFRVTGMGFLHYIDRGSWAEGFAHTMEGLLMLPVAFLLFWLLHVILSKIVVEEADQRGASGQEATPAPSEAGGSSILDMAAAVPGAVGRGLGRFFGALSEPARIGKFARSVMPDLRQRHFVAVAGVLLVSAVSWNVVNAIMGTVFLKHPVPLKQALDRFPDEIPQQGTDCAWAVPADWGPAQRMLGPDIEKTLGAKHPTRLRDGKTASEVPQDSATMLMSPQYIQRLYVLTDDKGRPVDNRMQAYFFVSYYTGEPDVVPHVPERCYLGGGYTENVSASKYPEFTFAGRKVNVRRVQFFGRDEGERRNNVIYFFCFNGQMEGDHTKVRLLLNSPFGKYAYYAKVEVKFPLISDEDEHQAAAEKFLQDFMPIMVRDFLPDWPPEDKTR